MKLVKVVDSDGRHLPGQFEAISFQKAVVRVRNVKTGETMSVHCTRVKPVGEQEPKPSEGDVMATKKGGKVIGVPFDWKTVTGERWSKKIKFDHVDVGAEAHVVIDAAGKTYRTFNTYNGSLGQGGKGGNSFAFEDYVVLTYKLRKKGYRKIALRGKAKVAVPQEG